jgi:hypothetical protein
VAWLLDHRSLVTITVPIIRWGEPAHHRAIVVNNECVCGRAFRDRLHLCPICGIAECECRDRP